MCICLKLGHISEWLTISYVAGSFLYKSILELDKVLEKLWGNQISWRQLHSLGSDIPGEAGRQTT